jgi:hypothetical protein
MPRRLVCAALLTAACGGGPARPGGDATAPDTGTRAGHRGDPAALAGGDVGAPDAGTRAGHRGDPAALFAQPARGTVRVPEHDATPPLALLRLDPGGGAAPIVHDSPVRRRRAPVVRLPRPELAATALIRDADGGTGRVRVSVVYVTRCGGTSRQHGDYFPPAQIETIRIAPGVRVPVQHRRSARVRFPPGCDAYGKAFAEATNAQGLESFSDPIWFSYVAR